MNEQAEDVQCEKVSLFSAAVASAVANRPERSRWSSASTFEEVFRGQDARKRPQSKHDLVGDSALADFGPIYGPINPMLLPFTVEFIGYPTLAMLRQNILVQNIVTTYAEEMTKKWVEVSPGDDTVTEEDVEDVRQLDKEWKTEDFFRDCLIESGFSGGCLAFIDNGDTNLEAPLTLDEKSFPKDSLRGFRIVEPMNAYAMGYNAYDPLAPNYFVPQYWNIQGKDVHASRFLYFAETNLPLLLKPAYNFFGIPMPQMLLDYVYNFERSRDSAARAIRNHSLLGLLTDLSQLLQSGISETNPQSIINRIRVMQATRDQDGIALLDKATEEFFQITTPLTGMMELTSQQLELLALVTRLPVTKLFGTPPRGFNASGDNYQEDFAHVISGRIKRILHDNVVKYHKIIQLNKHGRFIEALDYKWPDIREMSEKEKADIRLVDAQADAALVTATIIDPSESRERLAGTPNSGYEGIYIGDADAEEEDEFEQSVVSEPEEDAGGVENPGARSDRPQRGVAANLREEAPRPDSPDAGRRPEKPAGDPSHVSGPQRQDLRRVGGEVPAHQAGKVRVKVP